MGLGDMAGDLRAAAEAQKIYADALREHQAACIRKDWPAAQAAREKAMAAAEAFFDHFENAHKR